MDKHFSNNGIRHDDVNESDPLIPWVMAYAIQSGQITTLNVQRKFSIGFLRAARTIDSLEAQGFIGPSTGSIEPRKVFMTAEQYKEAFEHDVDDISEYVLQEAVSAIHIERCDKEGEMDQLAARVMAYAIKSGKISTSVIQRRFNIGYARSGRIIDSMEAHGFIGPATGSIEPRKILMTAE